MAETDEKLLDSTLNMLIQQIADLKQGVEGLLFRLEKESETLNWPAMLNNFLVISGALKTLDSRLRNDSSIAKLHKYVVLPLQLDVQPDAHLQNLTQNRLPSLNPDIVPNYLRTKPDKAVEDKYDSFEKSNVSADNLQKQIGILNRIATTLADTISSQMRQWESDNPNRSALPQTSSRESTQALLAAVNFGAELRNTPQVNMQQQHTIRPQLGAQSAHPIVGGAAPQVSPATPAGMQTVQMNRMPSGMRVNVRPSQPGNPYQRQ